VKVLLDENLDPRLRNLLEDHQCTTVLYAGWAGLKNGMLLATAEAAGFQVFLTGDRKIPQEQTMDRRRIAIVVLTAHQLSIIQGHVAEISSAIHLVRPGEIVVVECGEFRR
jgi:predicted nuclease of predicted toxin-antitoxin system